MNATNLAMLLAMSGPLLLLSCGKPGGGESAKDEAKRRQPLSAAAISPSNAIPPRAPDTPSNLIDLSSYYNAGLVGSWHPTNAMSGNKANDLAALPGGIRSFDDVKFDVRGLIQLVDGRGSGHWGKPFGERVAAIKVNQKCKRLHFLQGTGYTAKEGAEIGGYEIHFANNQSEWFPIIYGQDVRDWWAYKFEPLNATRSVLAWSGTNESAGANGLSIRLYKSTWENPHPDVAIDRIDFQSTKQDSAPFLLAITAD